MNAMKLLPLMRLLHRCRRVGLWWRVRRAPDALAVAASVEATPAEEQEAQEAPRGCGWFDSSHDLQRGLRVQEHLNADSLVRELPLGAWLDLQLGGWRPATPVLAPTTFTHAT